MLVLVCEGPLAVLRTHHGQVVQFLLGVLGQGLGLGVAGLDQVTGLQIPIFEVVLVDEAVRRVSNLGHSVLLVHDY